MDYSKKTKKELIEEIEILKRKEKGISMIISNVKEMFYKISFDNKGNKNMDYVSPQVENVLGISPHDYINNQNLLIEHFHPQEIDKLIKETKKIKKGNENITITYRFYNKKLKKYVWIEENIVTTFDNKGNKKFIFGTLKNVTKKISQQQQLEFILENIDYCIYNVKFFKKEKLLNYVSHTIKDITGLTEKEFESEGISGKLIKRVHPDDVDMVNKSIKEELYIKKKKKIHTEFRFKPKGKKNYLWIEENVFTSYNKKGNIIEITTVMRDITEQKKHQEELKLSEKSYKDLFNESPDLLYIQDQDGKFLDVNKTVIKKYGYSRKEIIGKTPEFLSAPDKNNVNKIHYKINKAWEGKKQTFEFYGISKSGKEFLKDVVVRKGSYFGKDVIIAFGRDITKSKAIENHLKESEEKYKNIFTKNMAGVFITENDKIIECNNAFAKIFGFQSRVQIIGKPSLSLYFSKKEREDYLKDLSKNNSLSNYRIRHKKKDGSELWILTNVTKIKNRIEGTLIEFTDQIKREQLEKEHYRATIAEKTNKILEKEIEERKKVEKKLIENQKYTNSIINSSIDVICASDNKGNIIEMNSSGLQVFGYSEDEIVNKNAKILYATDEEFIKVFQQLNKTGNYIGEIKNTRKNGEVFTSFLSASLLYDDNGNVIGSMGVSRDITELKEAELQLIESEEKYRDLFENATDLIQSVDINGKFLYVNNTWKNKLGYTEEYLLDKTIFDIIHPDCMDKCEKFFSEIFKKGTNFSQKIDFELQSKSGKKVIVDGNVSLKYQNGQPHSTRAILRDVTNDEWEKAKQNVYNNIAKIINEKVDADDIYENIRKELSKVIYADVFSISFLIDKNVLDFTYYYDYLKGGRIYLEKRYKKHGLNEYIIEKSVPVLMYNDDWQKIISKGDYKFHGKESKVFVGVPLKIKNKVIGVVAVQSYDNKEVLDEKSKEILEFISTPLALTVQRKYDESKIQEQSARLESIIENSTHLFWTFNKDLGLTTFNKNFDKYAKEAYGKTVQPNLYRKDKIIRVSENSENIFWDEKYEAAYQGKQQHFITNKIDKKGNRIIKDVFLNPIIDEKGNVLEISGIAHDISKKIIAEEQLKESLKQKEVLLKEVHHRVKNNLQIISSILNLQTSYTTNQKVINILKESQDRIRSMSFIHESLYQNNDFSKINFSAYISNLSKNLVLSYRLNDSLVDLDLKIKEVTLDLDSSIPCGLIVNELVTNALKYAFKKSKKGIITIELFTKNNDVTLIVEDNGIGLPKNINIEDTDTLGLQLVITLVEQIDGQIDIDNKNGTKFTIKFKKKG